MKQSPEEKNQLNRMLPSKFSGDGFLGSDKRTVNEIIADDLSTLEQINLSKERLAEMLELVFDKAKSYAGVGTEIAHGLIATHYESRGKIPSPFVGDGTFEKGEVVLCREATNEKIRITPLSIFLIKKYGFFQGSGAPYRINPRMAADLLSQLIQNQTHSY